MKISCVFFLLLSFIGCNDPESSGIKYLNEVFDIMEKNSINRKTIDWPTFRSNAIAKANGGESPEDVNTAIRYALITLGDDHSFVVHNSKTISASNHTSCTGNSTEVTNLNNIGYIKIPGYSGVDNQFAINIQNEIKAQDNSGLVGWIVDLRGNTGGNMWPMLAGVGPVLGNGVAGYFIDPDEVIQTWEYNNGSSISDGSVFNTVPSSYTLIHTDPKVAVLTDQQTGSSGEAIVVAFIGRANTRSFGVATCGLSTANAGFPLSDGGKLWLTVAVMADRNKNKKGGPVIPDVTVAGDQEVVSKAVDWLTQ